jgi:hypothetical protein
MASFVPPVTPARDELTARTTPPALERRASRTGAEEPFTLAVRMATAGRIVLMETPFQAKMKAAQHTAIIKATEHDGHPGRMVPGGNTYFSTTNDALRNPAVNPELTAHIANEMRGVVQGGNEVYVIPTEPNPHRAPNSTNPLEYSEAELTERCAFTPTTIASTLGASASVGVELPLGAGVIFVSCGTKDACVIGGRVNEDGTIVPAGIDAKASSFGVVRSATPETARNLLSRIGEMARELKTGEYTTAPVHVYLYSSIGYSLIDTVGAAIMTQEGLPEEILYTGGPLAGLRVLEATRRENPVDEVSNFILIGRNGAGYDAEVDPIYPMDSSIACGIALLWAGLPVSAVHPRFIHD